MPATAPNLSTWVVCQTLVLMLMHGHFIDTISLALGLLLTAEQALSFQPGLLQTCSMCSAVIVPPGTSSMQSCDYGLVSSQDRPGVTSSHLRMVQSLVLFLGWFCESEGPSPLASGTLPSAELLSPVQTTLSASPLSPRGCCAWIFPACFPPLRVQPLGSTSQAQGIGSVVSGLTSG